MLARLFEVFELKSPGKRLGSSMIKMAKNMEGKAVLYYAILATDALGHPFWWNSPELQPTDQPSDYDLQGRLTRLPANHFFGVKLLYYPCPFATRSWMEFEIMDVFRHPLSVKDWQTIVTYRFPCLYRLSLASGDTPNLAKLSRMAEMASEAQQLAARFVRYIFGQDKSPDMNQCLNHWNNEEIFAALVAAGPGRGPSLINKENLPRGVRTRAEKYWEQMACY